MKKNNKEKVFYSIIFIIYVILVSYVAIKHEYWADEANAWLLARDRTIWELFTTYAHSDGHPILWHIIIKFFQTLGLDYNNFNLISVLFSSLGVFLFLFKSNYKWYIKMLLPFSYFIFYQYAVIARGYCLIFPVLSILAIIWEKRKEHYLLFVILLTLLINMEAYTLLLAGSIYLLEIIDYIKNRKKYKKDILYYLILLFFIFLLTVIYVCPLPSSTYISAKSFVYYIANSFMLSNYKSPTLLNRIVDFIIIMTIVITYYKNNKQAKLLELLILFLPMYLFLSLGVLSPWHLGIPLIFFIFAFEIHKVQNFILIILLLVITCTSQIIWSYKSSIHDIKESYSWSKEIADFIKKYDYNNMKIVGLDFYASAVNPYFNKNLYLNYGDNSFFYFDISNPFYRKSYFVDNIIRDEIDMIIVYKYGDNFDYKLSNDEIIKNNYNKYIFKGKPYFINQEDTEDYMHVYVSKNKDYQISNN